MSGLSPELKQLVVVYRGAKRPSEADTGRIFEGLRSRLGDAAIAGTESVATSTGTGALVGKGVLAGLAGLAVLGGGVWFLATPAPQAESTETNTTASAAASLASAVVAPVVPAVSSSEPPPLASAVNEVLPVASAAPIRDVARPAASHHSRDRLAEEVALLSRAQAALRSGKPALALEVLSEHERKFSNGLLGEERIAARVRALCALGRSAEADAQLARLSPKSLHGQSPQACGSRKSN